MKGGWYDNPVLVRRLTLVFWIACGLLVVAGLVAPSIWTESYDHLHYAIEGGAWYAVIGFVAFVLLVTIARVIKPLVWRRTDFYDDRAPIPGEGEDP